MKTCSDKKKSIEIHGEVVESIETSKGKKIKVKIAPTFVAFSLPRSEESSLGQCITLQIKRKNRSTGKGL